MDARSIAQTGQEIDVRSAQSARVTRINLKHECNNSSDYIESKNATLFVTENRREALARKLEIIKQVADVDSDLNSDDDLEEAQDVDSIEVRLTHQHHSND